MMILEFLEGGPLDEWLPANGPQLHGTELLSVVHQIALGLVALGRAGIVHRDLTLPNMLLAPSQGSGRAGGLAETSRAGGLRGRLPY